MITIVVKIQSQTGYALLDNRLEKYINLDHI